MEIYIFFSCIAQLVQAAIFGLVHILTSFDIDATVQLNSTLWGIRLDLGVIPAFILIIIVVTFLRFYPLYSESTLRNQEIVKEMGI